jgi:hypothetical protein
LLKAQRNKNVDIDDGTSSSAESWFLAFHCRYVQVVP